MVVRTIDDPGATGIVVGKVLVESVIMILVSGLCQVIWGEAKVS